MNEIIRDRKINYLFGGEFELIDSGYATGKENMEFDIGRTEACIAGTALPMFRLYGWNPWCVSLGANQKESDIDKSKCDENGFDIVRRPTGGRAVLHAEEITYSVVMKLHSGLTVHDAYREIHVVLLNGLKRLGALEIDFEKTQSDFRNLYRQEGTSVSCFTSSARYEIEWAGKKIVGSAQRLFGDTLLQHGSILLGSAHEKLPLVANVSGETARKVLIDYTKRHSACLANILGKDVSYKEASEKLIEAVCV